MTSGREKDSTNHRIVSGINGLDSGCMWNQELDKILANIKTIDVFKSFGFLIFDAGDDRRMGAWHTNTLRSQVGHLEI